MFYLFLGAWVLGLDLLLGSPYSLDQLFSYKVEPLSRHFLMGYIHFSGAGWEPCRGKTPHSWIHLQLSHLLPRPLVHCAEDKAMSRLFLHGLITAHRSENYHFFPFRFIFFTCWSAFGGTQHYLLLSPGQSSILKLCHLQLTLISRWVINLVCAALMCVTGEFLCMRTELRTIPVNMAGGATAHQQPKTDHL